MPTDKAIRSLPQITVNLILFGLAVVFGFAVWTQRGLFMDGSSHLVEIMEKETLRTWFESRQAAISFHEWPTLKAIEWFGIKNSETLAYIYSACVHGHNLLSLGLSYILLRHSPRQMIWVIFPILSLICLSLTGMIICSSEHHFALNLYWPLLIWVTLTPRVTVVSGILGIFFSLLTFKSYESFAAYSLVLMVSGFLRAQEFQRKSDKPQTGFFVFVTALFLISSIYNLEWIIWPQDIGNRNVLWNATRERVISAPFVFGILGATLFLGMILKARTRIERLVLLLGIALISVLWCFTSTLFPNQSFQPGTHFLDRLLLYGLTAALGGIFVYSVWHFKRRAQEISWGWPCSVGLLLLAAPSLVYEIRTSLHWREYRKLFSSQLREYRGIIEYSDSKTVNCSPENPFPCRYNWSWTMPYLSVLWAPVFDGTKVVQSFVKNYPSADYSQIKPGIAETYPKIEKFGFKFTLK